MAMQHNHVPKETSKFLGELQSKYEKKRRAGAMLFNNYAKCTVLTPEYVSATPGPERR